MVSGLILPRLDSVAVSARAPHLVGSNLTIDYSFKKAIPTSSVTSSPTPSPTISFITGIENFGKQQPYFDQKSSICARKSIGTVFPV